MSNGWDDKLTEKFLTLYRKHKCLWNPYSPNYKNCTVKNEAFKIVVKELNVPRIRISECLQQIEVIREKYKQEQLKAEKELQSGKLYDSKVPWINLMSQMLCEVINDEENYSENSLKSVPCNFGSSEQNKDLWAPFVYGEFSNSLDKPEKYGESKSNQNISGISPNNNLHPESKIVNEANDPSNKCPSCGWEKEKNQHTTYNATSEPNKFKESGVQIEPGIEVPLRINKTKIVDTNTNTEVAYQITPLPPYINEMNYTNWKMSTPESDVMQNKKKVQINADVEQGSKRKCVPDQLNKCNVTEDVILREGDSRVTNSSEVTSSNRNYVHSFGGENPFEKNVITRLSYIGNNDQSQFSEYSPSNFEMNETRHRQLQKISEFKHKTNEDKDTCADRSNTCIQQFGKRSPKFTTSEEDKYEICSRFKIIIPTSDREDQNLEITGYEMRTMNPQLSKYILGPSSDPLRIGISNTDCVCNQELSVTNRSTNVDPARYSNIIKLDVNHKRSKKSQAKKRLRTLGTTCTNHEADPKNDWVSKINAQHKSFSNKKVQTEICYENEAIQTLKDMKTSQLVSSKSVKDQTSEMGVSLINESSRDQAAQVMILNNNENFTEQHQSTRNDESRSQIEGSVLPEEQYNNTRIFLNVIVKILESDDTHERSDNLQTTLDTMLDKFQQMSTSGQNATQNYTNEDKIETTFNNTSLSTQYGSLPPKLAPVDKETRNMNSQKSNDKTMDLVDMSDLRPQSPIRGISYYDEIPEDDTSMLILPGEINDTVDREASGNNRISGLLNETNKSINEKSIISGQPVPFLDNTSESNAGANSTLDYTNEFSNEEPIASSSRRIQEHRTPSQLAKDFLHVIRYTMMMDEALHSAEHGDNDCCKSLNNSSNPQNSRK